MQNQIETTYGCQPALVDINELAEIQDVVIDTSLPVPERKKSYLRQIKNPNLYRCDDTVVRVSYGKGNLEAILKEYLLARCRTALI